MIMIKLQTRRSPSLDDDVRDLSSLPTNEERGGCAVEGKDDETGKRNEQRRREREVSDELEQSRGRKQRGITHKMQ